ncbi:ead/Ea22-like family protein [Arthrobacter sp. AQ5-05]|uniref:ead/Ea22-like family protein n=1 Tax=Arthrobacter sp. AQ5-05 TaxID=2184581 RepID=UPI0015EC65B0|nr:ead/Ea22-like family protein [Arthrobacter sp. AQ5-05]
MTTPTPDLTALRKTAEAATPGPWEMWNPAVGGSHISIAGKLAWRSIESASSFADDEKIPHWADARHIAAFDPPTVLALLDRVEAAEKAVAAVRELHAHEHYDKYGRSQESPQGHGAWCTFCGNAPDDYCATVRALSGTP